jgi:hypothetical protein
MTSSRRFVEAFGLLSLVLTGAALLNDRGGGDYFFSLLGLVLLTTIAPYAVVLRVLARPTSPWVLALGRAAIAFGVTDVCVRTPALLFPDDGLNGAVVLWLPLVALVGIPLLAATFRAITHIIPIK